MRVYWDSSALLNALASKAVYDRLDAGENVTRSHGYIEVFSHLSGSPQSNKGSFPTDCLNREGRAISRRSPLPVLGRERNGAKRPA